MHTQDQGPAPAYPALELVFSLVRDADVLLEHGEKWLSKAIQWFTKSYWNHVGLVFRLTYEWRLILTGNGCEVPVAWGANKPGEPGELVVIEALWTIQVSLLEDRLAEPTRIQIATCDRLGDSQRWTLVRAALGFVGQKYGVRRLFAYAVDIVTRRWPALRTRYAQSMALDELVCSYFVAFIYSLAHESFGRPPVKPRECTPAHVAQTVQEAPGWRVSVDEIRKAA